MIILKADNRQLTKNAKYSYLTTNYNSGVSAVVVKNSNVATTNDYALLGEFGSQQAEIVKISSVTAATKTLNLSAATSYAHPQDTKVTILRYNQVKFYQTAAATFSASENPLGTENIQAYKTHTIYQDATNTTGYGWFCFYNETTAKITTNSNAIPYAGFDQSSVKEIFDEFFSLLNNKEMKLVSHEDAFRWLNEGYNKAQNELNLVNFSYKVEAEWDVTTTSGTQEYDLPSDFSNLRSVTNSDGEPIGFIPLSKVPKNDADNSYSINDVKYFLRGKYIGFSPVPTSTDTYYAYYQARASKLSSYYDNLDLPDNNFYPLIDFMLYRAAPKLHRPNPKQYLDAFMESVNSMKVFSHKQNTNKDSWSVDRRANV